MLIPAGDIGLPNFGSRRTAYDTAGCPVLGWSLLHRDAVAQLRSAPYDICGDLPGDPPTSLAMVEHAGTWGRAPLGAREN